MPALLESTASRTLPPVVREGRAGLAAPRIPPRDPLRDLAIRLDAAAVRLAKGGGAVDLAIGETLDRLFAGDRLSRLGYSRQVDFARERLGLPPRTLYAFLELARGTAGLDLLRSAVRRGDVSPRKARAVAPAIRRQPWREEMLTRVAARRTLPEIEEILRDMDEVAGGEEFVVDSLTFSMTPGMQEVVDSAIALATAVLGAGRPRYVYEEAIAMEFLAGHGDRAPEPGERKRSRRPSSFPPSEAERRRVLARWDETEDGSFMAEIAAVHLEQEAVFSRGWVSSEDPEELEERLRSLLALRRKRDEPLGRVLDAISTLGLHVALGYPGFGDYVRERLGMSESTARERVRLERRMCRLPELRAALVSGRLTYSKTLIVARGATPEDVEARIGAAEETSWQQLAREQSEEEDRQNRAAGIRRLWGPEEAIETIAAAIVTAQAVSREDEMTPGEAYAAMAAEFVGEWSDPVRRRRIEPLRRAALARTKGICATPGCSNPADHAHHIVYRSREGRDELTNLTGLCWSCHRRVHRGRMRVTGQAGVRLEWRIPRGRRRVEIWETIGDDDVRKIGVERAGVRS